VGPRPDICAEDAGKTAAADSISPIRAAGAVEVHNPDGLVEASIVPATGIAQIGVDQARIAEQIARGCAAINARAATCADVRFAIVVDIGELQRGIVLFMKPSWRNTVAIVGGPEPEVVKAIAVILGTPDTGYAAAASV